MKQKRICWFAIVACLLGLALWAASCKADTNSDTRAMQSLLRRRQAIAAARANTGRTAP